MNKSEVLKKLADELDLTQAETETIYNSFVEEISQLLENNKGFTLPGLGSFSTYLRPAHTSYNPHYKKKMVIPEKNIVKYSQSSVVRDEINGGGDD